MYAAGSVVNASCPLTATPVFGRTGSIIPLNVSTSDVGHGDCSFAGSLTLYVHTPVAAGSTQV